MDKFVPLEIPAGVYRNGTDYESKGRWFDTNLVRFIDAAVKPLGGWQRLKDDAGADRAALVGVPRGMHAWRGPTGNPYLVIGTTQKLYALQGSMSDITPAGFAAGQVDTGPATGATGNFGVGNYGVGAFGRGQVTLAMLDADTWQFDEFGDYLAAVDTKNQKLYIWTGDGATPAQSIDFSAATGNPTTALGVVVTPERFLVLLGVGGNVRRLAWASQQNYQGAAGNAIPGIGQVSAAGGVATFTQSQAGILANGFTITVGSNTYTVTAFNGTTSCTLGGLTPTFANSDFTYKVAVWAPRSSNTAGSWDLKSQGKLMCAKPTVSETLLWTDVDVHTMTYIGGSLLYKFKQIGDKCGVISRRAVVMVGSQAFWMSKKSFYNYNGFVNEIPSEVRDYVFTNLNYAQAAKIWATSVTEHGEVTWYYCSSTSMEIDSYVTYNYRDNWWSFGKLARTAGVDSGAYPTPIMVTSDGKLYEHEVGFEHDGVRPYAECGPAEIGEGDTTMSIQKIVPDEKNLGDVNVTFYTRLFPNDTETVRGPYSLGKPLPVATRFKARQVRMRVQEVRATDWRVGIMRFGVVPSSRR